MSGGVTSTDTVRVRRVGGGYAEVRVCPIGRALIARVDWWVGADGYVTGVIGGRMTSLHREVCPHETDEVVDHINRNRLDCRRENLRAVPVWRNAHNRTLPRGGSGERGVSRLPSGRYRARISIDGRRIELGEYRSLESAQRAVAKARRDWGLTD